MKNLFIASNPNIEKDDLWLVFKLLFQPWRWRALEHVERFEKEVERYINKQQASSNKHQVTTSKLDTESLTLNADFRAVAFDSARSSLALLLKEYGITSGDEVIVPSFTCVVVINAVLKVGATPIYIDTDSKTFNIDLEKLRAKVSSSTKAIIVQHTFGVAIDMEKVRNIVGKDVKVIEDVAHILGGENEKGLKYGTLGDAAILTFGIEKMITTLRGGMVLVKDEEIYKNLKLIQTQAPVYSLRRIFIWLCNPMIWAIATPLYYVGLKKFTIGRLISQIGHKLGLMGNMMEACEYKGEWPAWLPSRLPGAFAILGLNQLRKLDKFNTHRREIAEIYDEILGEKYSLNIGYTPLRYPVLVEEPAKVHKTLRDKHVILGNWYHKFLFTKPEFLEYLNFNPKEYPQTQYLTDHVINLPLNIKVGKEDAKQIAEVVKDEII